LTLRLIFCWFFCSLILVCSLDVQIGPLEQEGINNLKKTKTIKDVEERARNKEEQFVAFRSYVAKLHKQDMKSQLEDLVNTDMLKAMFLHLNTLANIFMSIPIPVGKHLLNEASHR